VTEPRSRTAAASDFDLEHFLPYRLSLLTNTVSGGIARSYRDRHDISITEWRILAVLGRYPGLTASEVVARTAMDKVAIHRAVKTLMEKGLLQRKVDKDDRRRQKLSLTPGTGQAMLQEIIPQARAYERRLLDALAPEDFDTLTGLLAKLQARAEQLGDGRRGTSNRGAGLE